eukprot:UN28024
MKVFDKIMNRSKNVKNLHIGIAKRSMSNLSYNPENHRVRVEGLTELDGKFLASHFFRQIDLRVKNKIFKWKKMPSNI